ncbi:unnamed protein product [Miscanthus lutarioriparius]|uniref:Uncharacterized protein n=1 Tax=Miscanthus lutarioriparius TaxID=422564 RepID=A0A811NJ48_9POAL|nr:unnamed protein product [Miscanthus lutarioriparius]
MDTCFSSAQSINNCQNGYDHVESRQCCPWITAPKLDNIFHISVICMYSLLRICMIWLGPHLGCKSQNGCTYATNNKFLAQLQERDVLKGTMHEVLVQNFTSSVPLFSMCGCNQEGCKKFGEATKIHILYQATVYISGWVNAFIYVVKSKMQPGGMQTVQRGHQDSHPVSGNSIHQWLCECIYLVKTNALDLLVGNYWYVNSL